MASFIKRLKLKQLIQNKKFLVPVMAVVFIAIGASTAALAIHASSNKSKSLVTSNNTTTDNSGSSSSVLPPSTNPVNNSSSQSQTSTPKQSSNCGQIDASAITQYSNTTHIPTLNTQQDYDAYNQKVATAYQTYKNTVESKGCTPVLKQSPPFTYTAPVDNSAQITAAYQQCYNAAKATVDSNYQVKQQAENNSFNLTISDINATYPPGSLQNTEATINARNHDHDVVAANQAAYNAALASINC